MELIWVIGLGGTACFVAGYIFAEVTRSSRQFVDDPERHDQHDEDEHDVVDD